LDGKGKLIGKANLSLILRIWKIPHNIRKCYGKWVNYWPVIGYHTVYVNEQSDSLDKLTKISKDDGNNRMAIPRGCKRRWNNR
jgi:hypothetical protein